MKKISIIDYGCGNILNLVRAIKFLGYEVETTNNKKKILDSSNVILPGVGAFGNAIERLKKYELQSIIIDYAKLNRPLLGICLGMQLLLSESREFGVHKGLDLIEGKVIKIPNNKKKDIKIPHIGWNELYPNKDKAGFNNKVLHEKLFKKNFYFVHSYICLTKDPRSTIAFSDYSGIPIPAFISKNNVYGCQFHPEKSDENGLEILKNFCKIS